MPRTPAELATADDVVRADLDYIAACLEDEFRILSGKRLLITGGAGFLGYYLTQSLLHWNIQHPSAAPIQLTVLDSYIRGVPTWLKRLEGNCSTELIRHDITRPLPDHIRGFEYAIHAASIASPTYYRKYPIETMDANVNGLRHLLDYCVRMRSEGRPVAGLVYCSTSEIYGDPGPTDIPTPETYRGFVSCTGPRACYDESKRYGETLCVNFAQQYDIAVKTVRPFNNYGPGLKISDRRVLPDFARDVLNGRDIVMLSDGSPTRTFCYVADAIIGYYKVLVRGRAGEAYNIGAESPEISMGELAERTVELARRLFRYEGSVVHRQSGEANYMVDNPNRRCPAITKARAHVGFDPRVSLSDGLERSLIWYAGNRQAEEA